VTKERLSLGKQGEEFAAGFLKKQGYKIKETNYRSPLGEIDIIAIDRDTLVFIEVKTRKSIEFGSPFEAVNGRKKRQIAKTAQYYLLEKKISNTPLRFDVVSVSGSEEKMGAELIRNAFEVSG